VVVPPVVFVFVVVVVVQKKMESEPMIGTNVSQIKKPPWIPKGNGQAMTA